MIPKAGWDEISRKGDFEKHEGKISDKKKFDEKIEKGFFCFVLAKKFFFFFGKFLVINQ